MNREEEIINASIEYTLSHCPICLGGDSFSEAIRSFNRNKSFEEGAKWADKHFNSDLWIDVKKDLPYNHPELLINKEPANGQMTLQVLTLHEDGKYHIDSMYICNDGNKKRWVWWSGIEPLYWMVIPISEKINIKPWYLREDENNYLDN